MGMPEYEEAVRLMRRHPEKVQFAGPRSQVLISAAERRLALKMPPTYRRFLQDFGAGSFGSEEVYGVIEGNFEESSVPDAIWCTITERRTADLPPNLLAIGNDGGGRFFCIECVSDSNREAPVVLWEPDMERSERERVASDFGEFLLTLVRSQLPESK
jgi:hypothetical protein